jgi:polyisoprenoid-binding protein YceI
MNAMNSMQSSLALTALACTLSLTGCPKGDVAAGDPATTPPVASAPLSAPAAPTSAGVKFSFDDTGSKITWVGKKITGKHDGAFQKFKGTADVVAADLTKGSVAVVIDMNSITTDNDRLIKHLKSDDFFAADKFPHAKFTSTSIAPATSGGTHTISGNLEIKGVSRPVTFPATIAVTDATASLDGDMTINRQDFGVAYKGKPDDLIEDNVTIHLEIRAKKE